MIGRYLHICAKCGNDFFNDCWDGPTICPDCMEEVNIKRSMAISFGEQYERKRKYVELQDRLDREYLKNPPKISVHVENGVRIERRGNVPVGANRVSYLYDK